MTHTRQISTPQDLFKYLHDAYSQIPSEEFSSELVSSILPTFSKMEFVEFCNIRPNHYKFFWDNTYINGLWLLLWHDAKQNAPIMRDIIEELLISLPDDLFCQLDFSARTMTAEIEISTLVFLISKPELLNKIFTLPDNKIDTLYLGASISVDAKTHTYLEKGLLILIDIYCQLIGHCADMLEFQENFLHFATHITAFDDNFTSEFERLPESIRQTALLKDSLSAANRLKRAAADDQGSSFFASTESTLAVICKDESLSRFNCFFADLVRGLLPDGHPRLPSEIVLIEKILFAERNGKTHPLLAYANHFALANHFFTQLHNTLPSKLQDLRLAFVHAIKAWLLDTKKETSTIMKIAEAYLFANPDNFNKIIGGCTHLPQLTWLSEEIDKLSLRLPESYSEKFANDAIDRLFSRLSLQRDIVEPLYKQLAKVQEANDQLKKENIEYKKRLQPSEQSIASLVAKIQILEKKLQRLEPEPTPKKPRWCTIL